MVRDAGTSAVRADADFHAFWLSPVRCPKDVERTAQQRGPCLVREEHRDLRRRMSGSAGVRFSRLAAAESNRASTYLSGSMRANLEPFGAPGVHTLLESYVASRVTLRGASSFDVQLPQFGRSVVELRIRVAPYQPPRSGWTV